MPGGGYAPSGAGQAGLRPGTASTGLGGVGSRGTFGTGSAGTGPGSFGTGGVGSIPGVYTAGQGVGTRKPSKTSRIMNI